MAPITTELEMKEKVGFIGGGNMAKAICEGMVRNGIISYKAIWVSAASESSLEYWRAKGANATTNNGLVVVNSDIVFLSVKPHILPLAVTSIYESATPIPKGKLFVSILAGVRLEALENCLSGLDGRLIRSMPNTPMMVGEGITVFSPGQRATDDDVILIKKILQTTGSCREVPESLIDAISSLSGSGPAFVYLIIEALSDGGVKMGIPRDMSTEFAAQTVLGAAKMVLETGRHTGKLKDEVCSAGGSTIAGIHALERGGVRGAIMDAIEVTTFKARELGK